MYSEEEQLKLLNQLEAKIDMCIKSVNWLVAQIDAAKKENTAASRKKLDQLRQKVKIEKGILDKYRAEFELICGG